MRKAIIGDKYLRMEWMEWIWGEYLPSRCPSRCSRILFS